MPLKNAFRTTHSTYMYIVTSISHAPAQNILLKCIQVTYTNIPANLLLTISVPGFKIEIKLCSSSDDQLQQKWIFNFKIFCLNV